MIRPLPHGAEASDPQRTRVGVLALQGDFAAHARALAPYAEVREVRTPGELAGLDGLVLPGGESTALLRLLRSSGLGPALPEFHRGGGALFGTCAGLILLAREVRGPAQESLGLLDVVVERNAYGRQVESFVAEGELAAEVGDAGAVGAVGAAGDPPTGLRRTDLPASMEMVFIRAPRIRRTGSGVRVLGSLGGEPVLIEQPGGAGAGPILAATFHPEMARSNPVHAYFVHNLRAGVAHPTDGLPLEGRGRRTRGRVRI